MMASLFSSVAGTFKLAIRVSAATVIGCNRAGGKTRHLRFRESGRCNKQTQCALSALIEVRATFAAALLQTGRLRRRAVGAVALDHVVAKRANDAACLRGDASAVAAYLRAIEADGRGRARR